MRIKQKNNTSIITLLLIAGASLVCNTALAQNLIYNGSFELGNCPDMLAGTVLGGSSQAGMPASTGWLNPENSTLSCADNCINSPVRQSFFSTIAYTVYAKDGIVQDAYQRRFSLCDKRNRSANVNYSFKPISGDHVAAFQTLFYPPRQQSSTLTQKLADPLLVDHQYYFYMFYCNGLLSYRNDGSGNWVLSELPDYRSVFTDLSTHNAIGIACYTYNPVYDNPSGEYVFNTSLAIEADQHQKKLRFDMVFDSMPLKASGTFTADSAFSHITLGQFWKPSEISYSFKAGANSYTKLFSIDSLNLWDVTIAIDGDTLYCESDTATLISTYYSVGYNEWQNQSGDSIGTGDTLKAMGVADQWIYLVRHFPDIEHSVRDSFFVELDYTLVPYTLSRIGDTCSLPTLLQVSTSDFTCEWNGVAGPNSFSVSASDTIDLIVTDKIGCFFDTSIFIAPVISFTAKRIVDSCSLPAQLVAIPDTLTYTWNGTVGGPSYTTSTSDTVYITATDEYGCSLDTSIYVAPLIAFAALRLGDSCSLPAQFISTPGDHSYTWNGTIGDSSYTTTVSDTLFITATDENGCSADTAIYIAPETSFAAIRVTDSCEQVQVVNLIPPTYQYTMNMRVVSDPVNIAESGLYTIVATAANGCKDTQYVDIPVCIITPSEIWVPNAFTPNSDAINQVFQPTGESIKSYDLTIYNRWGEQIFKSREQQAWDGTYLGMDAPQGVYIYNLTLNLLDGTRLQQKGTVTLLR